MDQNQTSSVTNRMNNLAMESTQTLIDAAYLAQRQSAQLLQAWLNSLDTNQQQSREVVSRLLQQTQEAQQLLQQYVQASVRSNVEAFTQASQAGASTVAQGMNQAAQGMNQTAQNIQGAAAGMETHNTDNS